MAIEDCEALFLVFGGLTGLTIDVWETLFLALGEVEDLEDLDTLFLGVMILLSSFSSSSGLTATESSSDFLGKLASLSLLCLLGRSRGVVSASTVFVTLLFILLVAVINGVLTWILFSI